MFFNAFDFQDYYINNHECPNLKFNVWRLADNQCVTTSYHAHLELGAANFGPSGHTKIGLSKTVIKDMNFHPYQANYINLLPEKNDFCPNPEYQYATLFTTANTLVAMHKSDNIIFHVNDIDEENTNDAVKKLQNYANKKGYINMIIEPVVDDYAKIDSMKNLSKYRKIVYETVHLKNPDESFFAKELIGPNDSVADHIRLEGMIKGIKTLLKISTYACNATFFDSMRGLVPIEAYQFLLSRNILTISNIFKPVEYIFPEGNTIWLSDRAKAFDIKQPSSVYNYCKQQPGEQAAF